MVKEDVTEHITESGVEYVVRKYTCPICKEEKSGLFIDDEICHGNGLSTYFGKKGRVEGCVGCIVAL